MTDLIEKIKQARQCRVDCDGHTFIVRRPTHLEAAHLHTAKPDQSEFLKQFVIDWENMAERDLIAGGSDETVEFDTDLFLEWVVDRPGMWQPLISAILETYRAHERELSESAKKPDAG